jgi:hypothetical protein
MEVWAVGEGSGGRRARLRAKGCAREMKNAALRKFHSNVLEEDRSGCFLGKQDTHVPSWLIKPNFVGKEKFL